MSWSMLVEVLSIGFLAVAMLAGVWLTLDRRPWKALPPVPDDPAPGTVVYEMRRVSAAWKLLWEPVLAESVYLTDRMLSLARRLFGKGA